LTEKQPWPTEIRLRKDRRALYRRFDDGKDYDLAAELLRSSVLGGGAGAQPEQRQTVPGKANVGSARSIRSATTPSASPFQMP